MAIEVRIPQDTVAAARTAIAALTDEHEGSARTAAAQLVAALARLGFEADLELPSGDVWIEVFRGCHWGMQDRLFAALAPYAQGRVDVLACDGARWGYELRDGVLLHEEAA
jgi:hypothetical protein